MNVQRVHTRNRRYRLLGVVQIALDDPRVPETIERELDALRLELKRQHDHWLEIQGEK